MLECSEVETSVAMELEQSETAEAETVSSNTASQVENVNVAGSNTGATTDSHGYVVVIDNLDMNVRRSFQRIDRTTESYHFCHAYAVLN